MNAEALYTMTTPNSARPIVAENNHRSICSFCVIEEISHRGTETQSKKQSKKKSIPSFVFLYSSSVPLCLCGYFLNGFLEHCSPMLEALEHVKTRARRCEQNSVALLRRGETLRDSVTHVRSMLERRGGSEFRFDR